MKLWAIRSNARYQRYAEAGFGLAIKVFTTEVGAHHGADPGDEVAEVDDVERDLKSAVNMYNADKRNARFAAEKEADQFAEVAAASCFAWPTYTANYMFAGGYGAGYGFGGGYGGSSAPAYINGGYFTPWGYQPYSMTITPTFGGAIYQGNGGMMGWGTYSPYSFGGFVPSYGWGGEF